MPFPEYDPVTRNAGTLFEFFGDRFDGVQSEAELTAVRSSILRELEDLDTLERGGWRGFVTATIAAILDPINLIPIGATANITRRIGMTALRAGGAGTVTGLGSSVLAEAALYKLQATRTEEEVALNVGASMVFGAAVGSISGLRRAKRLNRAEEEVALLEAAVGRHAEDLRNGEVD